MGRVKHNMLANLSGQAWTNLLNILFIPLYLKFLGIEAYGLVGFFVILQNLFGLMDLGLRTTLNREMARLAVSETNAQKQRDLLRTLEIVFWAIAFIIAVLVIVFAPIVANHWVNPQQLSVSAVENAIRLMGLAAILQFAFCFYQGGLMGLQRQVLVNGIHVVAGTVRSIGAVLVLWRISASIEAFFIWQIIVSALQTGTIAVCLWRSLPISHIPSMFQKSVLYGVKGFAAGVSGNAILEAIISQMDKVILSKMLSLKMFGYYTLAGSVASFLWSIIIPVNSALFPRFTQLLELRDEMRLADLYHRTCQFMSVALFPVAIMVSLFSREIMMIWVKDAAIVENTYMIVSLLIIATMLSGVASVPSYVQFASGWPQLYVYTKSIALIVFIPAIIFMINHYGVAGAAIVLVILQIGYLLVTTPIMHRRLLKGEKYKWLLEDVMLPFGGVIAVALVSRMLMPVYSSTAITTVHLFGTLVLLLAAAVLLTSQIRTWAFNRIKLS